MGIIGVNGIYLFGWDDERYYLCLTKQTIMCINCARCGEIITAPYWHDGKPYGYSCIKIVNPLIKKIKNIGRWVIPDSTSLVVGERKQLITSIAQGKKYKSLILLDIKTNRHISMDQNCIIGENNEVYINIIDKR